MNLLGQFSIDAGDALIRMISGYAHREENERVNRTCLLRDPLRMLQSRLERYLYSQESKMYQVKIR